MPAVAASMRLTGPLALSCLVSPAAGADDGPSPAADGGELLITLMSGATPFSSSVSLIFSIVCVALVQMSLAAVNERAQTMNAHE